MILQNDFFANLASNLFCLLPRTTASVKSRHLFSNCRPPSSFFSCQCSLDGDFSAFLHDFVALLCFGKKKEHNNQKEL